MKIFIRLRKEYISDAKMNLKRLNRRSNEE